MVDIDFFKNYNDNYGHIEGDKALRKVSDFLRHSIRRSTDNAYRFGGEEFILLFSASSANSSLQYLEEIRSGIQKLGIRHDGSNINENLTISIGAVFINRFDQNCQLEEVIRAADQALYEAKASGRNRVSIHAMRDLTKSRFVDTTSVKTPRAMDTDTPEGRNLGKSDLHDDSKT
jgi:diguanylate cyclase (GGDEF)-like protein